MTAAVCNSALGLTIRYLRDATTGLERMHATLELDGSEGRALETAQPGPKNSDRVALMSSGDRI